MGVLNTELSDNEPAYGYACLVRIIKNTGTEIFLPYSGSMNFITPTILIHF